VSVFDIIPVLRDRKQAKFFFSKNRQVVFSTRYQPKKLNKTLRLVAGNKYGVFRYFYKFFMKIGLAAYIFYMNKVHTPSNINYI
jgi:hypothetical protein